MAAAAIAAAAEFANCLRIILSLQVEVKFRLMQDEQVRLQAATGCNRTARK
jgi:acyl-CoA reductase-like NAD-dependent aldehyde dehydrogenase